MRIVFMGTPGCGAHLRSLIHGDWRIEAVVTQPDRPRGRGQRGEFFSP